MNKVVLATCGALWAFTAGGWARAADDNRIDIQAVVTETYDSNVARSDAELAAERGITQQDWIFQPAISVDLLLPVSRQAFFLKGSVGYDFYADNHILNNGNIDLQGGVKGQIATCRGTLTDDFKDAQTDLQYLSLAATKNTELDETVALDGSCGGQIGIVPTLSVSERWSNNSAATLLTSNYRDFDLKTGIAYRHPRFGELSTYFSYDQADFPNRDLLVGPATIQDGYKVYGVGVQYDRRLGARIEGVVHISYTDLRPDAASVQGFQGVTYGADVTVRFSPLLQAKLSLQRGVQPTIWPGVTYEVDNSYGIEADYTLGRKLKLVAGASGGSDQYHGADLIPNVDISSETLWSVRGSIAYQLTRRFGLELDATHEARDANVAAFSYPDNRVALSLKAGI